MFDDFCSEDKKDPLDVWSDRMSEHTKLLARTDVAPIYEKLQSHLVRSGEYERV